MSYQERRSLVNLISSVIVTMIYAAYMLGRYPQVEPYSIEIFRFWGAFYIILIPVAIASRIIITIVFAIINAIATRESEPPIMDERDKMVELKGSQYSVYVFALGFVLAMGTLVADQPPTVMFLILLVAGILAEIVSEASQFFFYRRGF